MRVLLTAAGSPGFLTLYKSFSSYEKNIDIFGCDCNPNSFGLAVLKNGFCVPTASSTNYIEEIVRLCKENKIEVLIPCSDEEVQVIGENIEIFIREDIRVLSNTERLTDIFNKEKFLLSVRKTFPEIVPDFLAIRSSKEFEDAYCKLSKKHSVLCVKPAMAHGSRGFRIIRESNLKDFFSSKPNAREISYEALLYLLSQEEEFPTLLLMEYMSEDEYSIDCIDLNKRFVAVSRRRDVIKDGICSAGEAIEKSDLLHYCKELYDHFKIKYHANFQFRYDKNNQAKIVELNPRFSGTMELCRGAGVDFASLSMNKLLEIPEKDLPQIRWGTKMQRVWQEVFFQGEKTFVLESIGKNLEEMNV